MQRKRSGMRTKFICIEGIHGCGKSTTAWRLYERLKEEGYPVRVFFETDEAHAVRNPCDLRFMSFLSAREYNNLLTQNPEHCTAIEASAEAIADDGYLVFYPELSTVNDELLDKLKSFQVYEGRVDGRSFLNIMLSRFSDFVKKAKQDEVIYIFESVIFQHIINELLRFSDITEAEMAAGITRMSSLLQPLNPILFHLRTDNIAAIIERIASERLSDNDELYPDWIDWMILYVKNSGYGEKHKVQNREDLLKYFSKRSDIEERSFSLLDMEKQVINIDKVCKDDLNALVYEKVISSV